MRLKRYEYLCRDVHMREVTRMAASAKSLQRNSDGRAYLDHCGWQANPLWQIRGFGPARTLLMANAERSDKSVEICTKSLRRLMQDASMACCELMLIAGEI